MYDARNENAAPRYELGSGKHRPKKLDGPYQKIGGPATAERSDETLAGPSPLSPKQLELACTAPTTSSHNVRRSASVYDLTCVPSLAKRFSGRKKAGQVCRTVDFGGGQNVHAVLQVSFEHEAKCACLCGALPSKRSLGWSRNTSQEITCGACARLLRALETGSDEGIRPWWVAIRGGIAGPGGKIWRRIGAGRFSLDGAERALRFEREWWERKAARGAEPVELRIIHVLTGEVRS